MQPTVIKDSCIIEDWDIVYRYIVVPPDHTGPGGLDDLEIIQIRQPNGLLLQISAIPDFVLDGLTERILERRSV